ncbi:electron transfer flavoprotein subunit beta/FixA family protein [Propionispora hippei]|uniref:Electron transfer flavoprotein small subunit n=1 Tax=Propionispora hippei DSM 15287 TaxID=1123003 RepID=A0A1M6JVI6_9FIRM|nr:electron transfer flavoprotein subunit beta/FixA family protein [Propionispora hippei]SHJ50707.1 electron transfer flavoprotein beta subunit [Propionispora hippei DSM 15287]
MKIIVCVKQVPLTGDVALHPEKYTLLRQSALGMLNPYDKEAMEMALALREKHGGQIYVLSMGPEQAREILRECLAMGADEAVLLNDPCFSGSDTLATSYILAAGVRKLGGANLILCGQCALDGSTAQVGPELAAQLDFVQITRGINIDIESDILTVQRKTENGLEWLTASLPALVTILQAPQSSRLPTVKGAIRAKNKEIPAWNAVDLAVSRNSIGISGSPTRVRRIATPFVNTAVSCQLITGQTPEQSARVLIGKLRENLIL